MRGLTFAVRRAFLMLVPILIMAMIACGVIGMWDAHHGFTICQATGDWFNKECELYTFDYADAWLFRMYMFALAAIGCAIAGV